MDPCHCSTLGFVRSATCSARSSCVLTHTVHAVRLSQVQSGSDVPHPGVARFPSSHCRSSSRNFQCGPATQSPVRAGPMWWTGSHRSNWPICEVAQSRPIAVRFPSCRSLASASIVQVLGVLKRQLDQPSPPCPPHPPRENVIQSVLLCEFVALRRRATPSHKHGLWPPLGFQQAFQLKVQRWGFRFCGFRVLGL